MLSQLHKVAYAGCTCSMNGAGHARVGGWKSRWHYMDVLSVSNVFLVADFTRILSLARDCFATSGSPTGISCDNNLQPTCVRYCRTHLCNDQDGDLHKRISPPDDGGTGVASLLRSSVLLVVCSWLIPSVVK